MTTPEQADSPQPVAATATADALVQNAGRLGLTWDLKPATVKSVSPLTVAFDDDTVAVGATSMIGTVAAGQRVYVIIVPPSGNFITGTVGTNVELGQGLVARAGSTSSTAAIGAETVVLTTNTFVFLKGRAYRWLIMGSYNQSAAGFWIVNIRKSLAGLLLGQVADNTTVANGPYRMHTGVFVAATANVTTSIVQTNAFSGAGTVTETANGVSPRTLEIFDVGPASDYPIYPAIT